MLITQYLENNDYLFQIKKVVKQVFFQANTLLVSFLKFLIPNEHLKEQRQQNKFVLKAENIESYKEQNDAKVNPAVENSIPESTLLDVETFIEKKQPEKEQDEGQALVCYTKYGKKYHKLSCRYSRTKIAECTVQHAIQVRRLEQCKICGKKA